MPAHASVFPLWHSALNSVVTDGAVFSHCEPLSAFTLVALGFEWQSKRVPQQSSQRTKDIFAPTVSHPGLKVVESAGASHHGVVVFAWNEV